MMKKKTTTAKEGSPEIDCYFMKEEESCNGSDFFREESPEDEDQLFLIDYTTTILDNLRPSAKHILQTIEACKLLVAYIKKVCMNAYQDFSFIEFSFTGYCESCDSNSNSNSRLH